MDNIKRFSNSIETQNGQFTFNFHPVNIRDKQLYHVYYTINNTEQRFHMQLSKSGNFIITDRNKCPDFVIELEKQLSQAILDN